MRDDPAYDDPEVQLKQLYWEETNKAQHLTGRGWLCPRCGKRRCSDHAHYIEWKVED